MILQHLCKTHFSINNICPKTTSTGVLLIVLVTPTSQPLRKYKAHHICTRILHPVQLPAHLVPKQLPDHHLLRRGEERKRIIVPRSRWSHIFDFPGICRGDKDQKLIGLPRRLLFALLSSTKVEMKNLDKRTYRVT